MRLNWETCLRATADALELRPYRVGDVAEYHAWMQDATLRADTASEELSYDEEVAMQREWMSDENKLTWILWYDSVRVGDLNFFVDFSSSVAEISVMVIAHRGRGLAFRACEMGMQYVREVVGVNKFIAKISSNNAASLKLFQKLGFTEFARPEAFDEVHLSCSTATSAQCTWECVDPEDDVIVGELPHAVGDKHLAKKDFELAIGAYSIAIHNVSVRSDAELGKLYVARSATRMKALGSAYHKLQAVPAESDAAMATQLNPSYLKAWYALQKATLAARGGLWRVRRVWEAAIASKALSTGDTAYVRKALKELTPEKCGDETSKLSSINHFAAAVRHAPEDFALLSTATFWNSCPQSTRRCLVNTVGVSSREGAVLDDIPLEVLRESSGRKCVPASWIKFFESLSSTDKSQALSTLYRRLNSRAREKVDNDIRYYYS